MRNVNASHAIDILTSINVMYTSLACILSIPLFSHLASLPGTVGVWDLQTSSPLLVVNSPDGLGKNVIGCSVLQSCIAIPVIC